MACPANCAGHGTCDFSQSQPICKCFDDADSTAGCFESFSSIPPDIGWNDNMNQDAPNSSGIHLTSKCFEPLLFAIVFFTLVVFR